MKTFIAALALCSTLSMSAVHAEDSDSSTPPLPMKHGRHFQHGRWTSHLLQRFDKDGSGTLDQAELADMITARMDHPHFHHRLGNPYSPWASSQSPKSAMIAPRIPHPSEIAGKMLKKFDANGDGVLDRGELRSM